MSCATWNVLVTAPYMQPVIERFRDELESAGCALFIPPVIERFEEEELIPMVPKIDGAICGDDRFTDRVLEAAPRLKVISKWGTGIDSIDREACRRRGVVLCNTPNAFSEPVADSVIGYMLSFARQLPWMDKRMKAGQWAKVPGRQLRECTLGILGVGDVGKAVTRRAAGFGMRVLGHDIKELPPEFVFHSGLEVVSKEELLSQSDFVSVNCDLNPTSRHIINAATLALMKPDAVLINTARGPLVDEKSLVDALQAGTIGGAALDVFEIEPLRVDSPLRSMDNVMLAAHNSNSSPLAWEHVHRRTIENLLTNLRESAVPVVA